MSPQLSPFALRNVAETGDASVAARLSSSAVIRASMSHSDTRGLAASWMRMISSFSSFDNDFNQL